MFSKMMYLLFCLIIFPSVFCKISLEDMIFHNSNFTGEIANFKKIQEKIKKTFLNTTDGRLTALKMFDASTKIPNGLVSGVAFDIGNFDECYGIQYGDIYGKYCLGLLSMNELTQTLDQLCRMNRIQKQSICSLSKLPRLHGLAAKYVGLHFAVCVPSNWSAVDIPGLLTYTEDFCYTKATEESLSTGGVITLVILFIFLVIIVASTTFDIFLYYTKKESPHELFLAYSVLYNGRKLFQFSTNPDQLPCLNGIKALSMMWVIAGHSYNGMIMSPLINIPDVQKWVQNAANMFMMGASVSVDTFFVVGGLVAVYTHLNSRDRGVKFNIIRSYVHRYVRLTPALIIVALFNLFLVDSLGKGPLWKFVNVFLVKPCEDAWWSTLLYINNFLKQDSCIPQTWYLSIDMQLFILSPIILIPLPKWPKVIYCVLGFLTIVGCVTPFAIGYSEKLTFANAVTDFELFRTVYYYQTYARFGPYVIGMILGIFIHRLKKFGIKITLSWHMVFALWLVCLVGLTACVYAGFELTYAKDDVWRNSMFLAFNRPAWAVSVAGVILLCVTGYGGPIDSFLSLPIFQFLTKLSYTMYLVHATVITVRYSAIKHIQKFSDFAVMHAFWGDFMFTLLISLILSISFESPVIILEKYILGPESPKRSQGGNKPAV